MYLRFNSFDHNPFHGRGLVFFRSSKGLKCLYTNPRESLSLVINHREAGENYNTALGRAAQLITSENREDSGIFSRALPSVNALARWQLDFNLRRAGHCGQYSPHGGRGLNYSNHDQVSAACSITFQRYLKLYDDMQSVSAISEEDRRLKDQRDPSSVERAFSHPLLLATMDLLYSHVQPDNTILHLGESAVLPLLLQQQEWNVQRQPIEDMSYDFIVFSINSIEKWSHNYHLSALFMEALYIVVTGDCDAAPTDLNINSSSPDFKDARFFDYSLLESICSEEINGQGLLLYKNTRGLYPDW